MTKLLENTSRYINIVAINQLARLCHDLNIDLWKLPRTAWTRPFRFHSFRRGTWCQWALHSDRPQLSFPQYARKAGLSLPVRRAG
jgi:hypothetical protein